LDLAAAELRKTTSRNSPSAVKSQTRDHWRALTTEMNISASRVAENIRAEFWEGRERDDGAIGALRKAMLETVCTAGSPPDQRLDNDITGIIARWHDLTELAMHMTPRKPKPFRYLGVWFEPGGRWSHQQQILTEKFNTLNDKISRSSPTREQAIYCINATINSALKYPLRIASVPLSVLRKWDSNNRRVVKEAGYLPTGTPTELMHLPKEQGGLGLESLELAVPRTQIASYLATINDMDNVTAAMTRAGRIRQHLKGGQGLHHQINKYLKQRDISIVETTEGSGRSNFESHITQRHIDAETANSNPKTNQHWLAFGDGATFERTNTSGWGCYMTADESEQQTCGRLEGLQANDGAEARAILEALLRTHPEDGLTMHCDNSSCISKWKHLENGTQDTTHWGFRALWNRIG